MQELMYLLKVGETEGLGKLLMDKLMMTEPPLWVRLATLAPLSNFGYPPGSEGAIIWMNNAGVVVGVDEDPVVPRQFVPWQNVAYLADGNLAQELAARNLAEGQPEGEDAEE